MYHAFFRQLRQFLAKGWAMLRAKPDDAAGQKRAERQRRKLLRREALASRASSRKRPRATLRKAA